MVNELDLEKIKGLTEEEATQKIKEFGHNELPSTEQRSIFAIVLSLGKDRKVKRQNTAVKKTR